MPDPKPKTPARVELDLAISGTPTGSTTGTAELHLDARVAVTAYLNLSSGIASSLEALGANIAAQYGDNLGQVYAVVLLGTDDAERSSETTTKRVILRLLKRLTRYSITPELVASLSSQQLEDLAVGTIQRGIDDLTAELAGTPRSCRICMCTDQDCTSCIERTGHACYWVEDDLCSACAGAGPGTDLELALSPVSDAEIENYMKRFTVVMGEESYPDCVRSALDGFLDVRRRALVGRAQSDDGHDENDQTAP